VKYNDKITTSNLRLEVSSQSRTFHSLLRGGSLNSCCSGIWSRAGEGVKTDTERFWTSYGSSHILSRGLSYPTLSEITAL